MPIIKDKYKSKGDNIRSTYVNRKENRSIQESAPTGLTATSEDDFIFFINGQYMEHDALTIKQAGSSLLLLVDTDSIGYSLESDDEIIASGKFNS